MHRRRVAIDLDHSSVNKTWWHVWSSVFVNHIDTRSISFRAYFAYAESSQILFFSYEFASSASFSLFSIDHAAWVSSCLCSRVVSRSNRRWFFCKSFNWFFMLDVMLLDLTCTLLHKRITIERCSKAIRSRDE
jgi:hypothetical protein